MKKGEIKIKGTIIQNIIEIVKNITEIGNKIVDSADAEKYSNGVHSLNKNVDDTFNKMRELIENNNTLTIEQKLEKLDALATRQLAARTSCDEAIKGNREHIAKITSEVFLALSTCGISYVPKLISKSKKLENKN